MYQANVVFQRRLCVEILEELKRLNQEYFYYYGVSTVRLYRYYANMVEKNYEQIKA
ncbi:hypothetical protein [Streptococcus intermedius]|nr:hypothetical protein [Streptococcus intermedius]